MKKFVCSLLLLFSFNTFAQTTTNIISPKNYYVTSSSGSHYNESFQRSTEQLNPQAFQYKLFIKNADGVAHQGKMCNGRTPMETFLDRIRISRKNHQQ